MRSILEKAFVALLNEEHDKAEEMFHQFIVERARQIHESNRAGDDYVLNENWNDEITSESYFSEDDLSDLEDDSEENGEDFGPEDEDGMSDMEDDMSDMEDGDMEDMSDMEDGDMEDGDMEDMSDMEDGDTDERIAAMQDQITELESEFRAMMDALQDEGEMSDDSDDSEDMDDMDGEIEGSEEDEEPEEEDAEAIEDDMDDEKPAMEGEENDEDGFDEITESIIDELEKINVSLDTDGKEIGSGGGFTQNRGAAIPMKSKDARQGGQPIKMKHATHKGFERETAPSVEQVKARRNNVKSADAALSKVSKEGNKSAEINKLSSETGNTTSPLEGK